MDPNYSAGDLFSSSFFFFLKKHDSIVAAEKPNKKFPFKIGWGSERLPQNPGFTMYNMRSDKLIICITKIWDRILENPNSESKGSENFDVSRTIFSAYNVQ